MDDKYKVYLLSPEWTEIRISLYEKRGKRCERCFSEKQIHVHHKTYKNIYNEEPEDLELLCKLCHEKEHGIVRYKLTVNDNSRKIKPRKKITLAQKVILEKTRKKKNRDKRKKKKYEWIAKMKSEMAIDPKSKTTKPYRDYLKGKKTKKRNKKNKLWKPNPKAFLPNNTNK